MKILTYLPRSIDTTLITITALLLFTLPLPETIALRNALLLTGSILGAIQLSKLKTFANKRFASCIFALLLLLAWVLLHFFFIGQNRLEQLYELKNEWFRSFTAAIVGISTGTVLVLSERASREKYTRLLIIGLSGTTIIYLTRYAFEIIKASQLLFDFYFIPYREKPALVVFCSMFFIAMLLKIDTSPHKSRLKLVIPVLLAALAPIVFFLSNTKNGFLSILASLISLIVINRHELKNIEKGRNQNLFIAIAIAPIVIAVAFHFVSNPAWKYIFSDIKVAIDIENYSTWKNRLANPMPVNEYGIKVHGSTYDRVAWATAGIALIKENPYGHGLINHSFGALAKQKWSDFYEPNGKNRGATHSGWIDLTLGIGVPGILLIFSLFLISYPLNEKIPFWDKYIKIASPVLFLIFLTTEVCSDHYLNFLFLYLGICTGLLTKRNAE
ncbi:O-antigen ligase family protein [Curvibacter sp. APW13]|uniref:O-antigen ligase family protein n=1 Tax=Curvibacter sp. APW13 TaxID=3077236 RepID=UPI0028DF8D5C|nr:O-antigen ligase family protein [Curvibacter sp. APW13]MDT8991567.1 O-antigen ligase family protein [Curvibacter sp. APW13]